VPWLAPALLLLAGLAKVWTWAGLVAIDEAVTKDAPPGRWKRLLPMILVGLGGIALDGWAGARYGPGSVSHPATFSQLAAAMAGVHARYVASLLWPSGLSIDYPVDPAGAWSDPWAIAGVLLALLAVAGLVIGVRRRNPALALGCGLWVLGLAPVNNVWPSTSVLRADRYLLVPAAGAYLLLAAAMARVPRARVVTLGVLAVVLGFLASHRAESFVDSRTVWTDAIEAQPATVVGRINRAADAAERGIWDRVERRWRRSASRRRPAGPSGSCGRACCASRRSCRSGRAKAPPASPASTRRSPRLAPRSPRPSRSTATRG
jgi:hypothetical protein